MSKNSSYDLESVGEWIAIATLNLVPAARDRVKLEIQAHFDDAVRSLVADGMKQEDAQARALLELGDPTAAAKELERRHLTVDEEKWLRKIEDARSLGNTSRGGSFVWQFMLCAWFILILVWTGWNLTRRDFGSARFAAVSSLLWLAGFCYSQLRYRYVLKKSFTKERVWRELLRIGFVEAASGLGACVVLMVVVLKLYVFVPVFLLLFVAQFFGRRFRVWRKLQRTVSAAVEAK